MNAPLPKKEIQWSAFNLEKNGSRIPKWERVLFFDPSELYERISDKINPYKRHQGLSVEDCFPKLDGVCACGCGRKPDSGDGWQRKWFSFDCQEFAGDVVSILNFYFGVAQKYIIRYYGEKCMECLTNRGEELDHVIGVKHGGGGCWLSNYRWLCAKCHRIKTNSDFGFNKKIKT